jgi:hypothetical protein
LKPGLGMVIMSLLVQRIGQRRHATPALLRWLHSGKGPHRLRAFLLPAGSPQSGKRKPGTSAGLGFTHSKQRGAGNRGKVKIRMNERDAARGAAPACLLPFRNPLEHARIANNAILAWHPTP